MIVGEQRRTSVGCVLTVTVTDIAATYFTLQYSSVESLFLKFPPLSITLRIVVDVALRPLKCELNVLKRAKNFNSFGWVKF